MTAYQRALTTPNVKTVRDALYDQLMKVMGLEQRNLITRCLYPVFYLPVQHISKLIVDLDRDIARLGWNEAIHRFSCNFVTHVHVQGAETIPQQGPLMVVANHPAAYDIVVLLDAIHRDDIKVLHSDIPLLQLLPNIAEHGIPVPYDINRRLQTVRSTITHLQNGGSIFIFPRGNVEPDPSVSPGAEESLQGWSSSLEIFLRRVPETKTIIAIASGMLSAKWYQNPLIRLWKKYEQRQKVAEIFQIAAQFITRKSTNAIPMVSFSQMLSVEELGGEHSPQGTILANIITQALNLLADHPHLNS